MHHANSECFRNLFTFCPFHCQFKRRKHLNINSGLSLLYTFYKVKNIYVSFSCPYLRGRVSKSVTNGSKTAVMDVTGFLCVAAQSRFMIVQVANAHAHVQRLVSVVNMVTVVESILLKSRIRFFMEKLQCKLYS
jgi:hypothetical protein